MEEKASDEVPGYFYFNTEGGLNSSYDDIERKVLADNWVFPLDKICIKGRMEIIF